MLFSYSEFIKDTNISTRSFHQGVEKTRQSSGSVHVTTEINHVNSSVQHLSVTHTAFLGFSQSLAYIYIYILCTFDSPYSQRSRPQC